MAKIDVRYFTTRTRSDGSERYYWQPNKALMKAGFKLETLSENKAEAIMQAQEFNRQVDAWRAGRKVDSNEGPRQITIGMLIDIYKLSNRYKNLAPKTRQGYDKYCFKIIREWAEDVPVSAITAKAVDAFHEALSEHKVGKEVIKTPAKAAAVIRALRLLLSHAQREGIVATNAASNPNISSSAKKGRLWIHDEVMHFVKTADEMGYFSVGSAVMLNEWMGQRKGDIIALLATAYRDGAIYIRQNKTNAETGLPVDMIPDLNARLQEQRRLFPNSLTLFPHESGKPMTHDTFRNRFEMIRAQAVKTRPEMHDVVFMTLRHTAVTRLAESGCEVPLIAAVTGHSLKTCLSIIDRYMIRTVRMTREAFGKRQAFETASLFPVETPAAEQNSGGIPQPVSTRKENES